VDEVSIEVQAPPEKVWAMVTKIEDMGRWSPECRRCVWLDGASGPAVGARFKGTNRHGVVSWSTRSTVTKADEPSAFEWQVGESGMLWGYRFEADGQGGTRITEYREKTKDTPFYVKVAQRSGILGRNREQLMVDGMRETLQRIKAAAEA
jgi:uncharacterized protein YndB with AHSA1/START domain